MEVKHMTELQYQILYPLIKGRDLLIKAPYSGNKSLALAMYAAEVVHKLNFKPSHGTGVMIVVPTEEHAYEFNGVLEEVMQQHSQNFGLALSGKFMRSEKKRIIDGMNILIATPGRLLSHLQKTKFQFNNLQYLLVDGADEIVERGLDVDLYQAVELLPKHRQTVVSSNNLKVVETLVKSTMKKNPLLIMDDSSASVSSSSKTDVTISRLSCLTERRFNYLNTILKAYKSKKVIVMFSSASSAKYHEEMFYHLSIGCEVMHAMQTRSERLSTFLRFCNAKSGILFCTELAACSVSMPDVDLLVQFELPLNVNSMLKRAAATENTTGKPKQTIIFLRPQEAVFVTNMEDAGATVVNMELPQSKVADVREKVRDLIRTVYALHMSSQEAYKAFINSYSSHALSSVFSVKSLDLVKAGREFGISAPPFVETNIHA